MRHHKMLLRIIHLILGLLLTLTVSISVVDPADAAKKKKSSSRKNFIPSETVGKKLLKIQALAEEEDFAGALGILEPLSQKKRLKKFDKATVFQMKGYMLGALERYNDALESFEVALAVDYLPDSAMQQLRFNLGQLYLAQAEYDRAIELFEDWLDGAEKPDAQAHFMITLAYAGKESWGDGLEHARLSVSLSNEPIENRLRLLLAVEFQNGNIPETLDILRLLATLFPKKDYYIQLAYGYSNFGEEEKALAVLELAYYQEFLDRERELTQLSQRYLYHNLPWRAAKVMESGLDQGIVEATAKNLELYANTLLHAREYLDAIPPLARAAEVSENGDLYVRLAQVHLEVEDWRKARKSLESAVEKGELRDPGGAQLLLGISNYNEKRFRSARTAFLAASEEENSQIAARKWLKHVNRALKEAENSEG